MICVLYINKTVKEQIGKKIIFNRYFFQLDLHTKLCLENGLFSFVLLHINSAESPLVIINILTQYIHLKAYTQIKNEKNNGTSLECEYTIKFINCILHTTSSLFLQAIVLFKIMCYKSISSLKLERETFFILHD